MNTLFCVVCVALFIAWIASDPAFGLYDRIKRSGKRPLGKKRAAHVSRNHFKLVAGVTLIWAAMTL